MEVGRTDFLIGSAIIIGTIGEQCACYRLMHVIHNVVTEVGHGLKAGSPNSM